MVLPFTVVIPLPNACSPRLLVAALLLYHGYSKYSKVPLRSAGFATCSWFCHSSPLVHTLDSPAGFSAAASPPAAVLAWLPTIYGSPGCACLLYDNNTITPSARFKHGFFMLLYTWVPAPRNNSAYMVLRAVQTITTLISCRSSPAPAVSGFLAVVLVSQHNMAKTWTVTLTANGTTPNRMINNRALCSGCHTIYRHVTGCIMVAQDLRLRIL